MELYIAYGLIAFLAGGWMAKYSWQNGSSDGIKPGSVPWTLATWIIFGLAWPIVLGFFLIFVLFSAIGESGIPRRILTRLFGGVS